MTMTWLTKLLYDSMLMNHWSIRIDNYVSKSNTVHQCTHWHIIHTCTAIVLRHYGLFCVVSKWQKHGHWQRGSWQAFDKHLTVDTTPSLRPSFGNHRSEHHHCRRTSHMGSDAIRRPEPLDCIFGCISARLHLEFLRLVWALVRPLDHCVWSTLDHGCVARPTVTGIRPAELSSWTIQKKY